MALGAGGRFPHAIVLRFTGAALRLAVPTPALGAYSKAHAVWPASVAMSLLHRLNLLEKFLILGTIGLVMSALPTYLVVRDSLYAIDHARLEAQGVTPAQALALLVQRMQVHRGLSVGMLGGRRVAGRAPPRRA